MPMIGLLTPVAAYITLPPLNASLLRAQGFFALTIDVRRLNEYESMPPGNSGNPPGHLSDAYFVESMGTTGVVPPALLGCKSCNVAVYCRTGQRSKAAALVLEAHGFTAVYDILGVTQWADAGLPLEIGRLGTQAPPPCSTVSCMSAPTPPPAPAEGDSLGDALPWLIPLSVGAALLLAATGYLAWSRRSAVARIDKRPPATRPEAEGGGVPAA